MHLWTQYNLEYNKKYSDPVGKKHNKGKNNIILSSDKFLCIDKIKTKLNNNILIIGDNRSNREESFIKPNILQANQNYIIIDHQNKYLKFSEKFLIKKGYTIQKYDLNNDKSLTFDPFDNINDKKDIEQFCECIFVNTNINCEEYPLLEKELINIAIEYTNKNNKTIYDFIELFEKQEILKLYINESSFNKNLSKINNKLFDYIFWLCKLRINILHKSKINNKKINFDSFKNKKQILFINIPLQYNNFGYLYDSLIIQLSKFLSLNENIPYTQFLLDNSIKIDFTNYIKKQINNNISYSYIINGISEIKNDYQTILNYFDIILYLGNNQQSTSEFIKVLFDMDENNKLEEDEIPMIEDNNCLIFLKNEKYFSQKFNIKNHKNYKYV